MCAYLAGDEVQVGDVDGLNERAIGGHSDFQCVRSECQHVGSHAHCKEEEEGQRMGGRR